MPAIDYSKLGTEEIQALLANDFTKVSTGTLRSLLGEEKPKPAPQMPGEDSGGFLQRLNESIVKRGSNVADALTPSSDESLGRTLMKTPGRALDVTGQVAGLIGDAGADLLASIVSGVTPNPVKEFAKEQVLSVLDTPIGKKGLSAIKQGMDSYALFKKENPEVAKHIEAGINIAGVIPFGRAAKVAGAVDDLTKMVVTDAAKIEKPGFFSKLREVVSQKMGNKADAAQVKAMLKNNGVTDAEIETTLGGIKGPVTKQQILEEIDVNGTKFDDVILKEATPDQLDRSRAGAMDYAEAEQWSSQKPKFSHYVEPGAVEGSYREMFVTAPGKEKGQLPTWEQYLKYYKDPNTPIAKERGYVPNEIEIGEGFDFDMANRDFDQRFLKDVGLDPNKQEVGQWADGHSAYSDIENPIIRVRFNDRDVDGKKVLFIEEMQGPNPANQEKMPEALKKRIYDIGAKRVLSYAKENGYDGVAWTPGKTQADRYLLSKQLKQVEVTSTKSGKDGYTVDAMDHNGNIVIRGQKVKDANELADTIGKELAQKAVDKIDENNYNAIFQGLDLEVGGEGLKKLYDRDLPVIFKKHGKEDISYFDLSIPKSGWRNNIDGAEARNTFVEGWNEPIAERPDTIRKVPYIPITDKVPNRYPMYGGAIGAGLAVEGNGNESK